MVADSTKTPEPPDTPIHFLFYYEWKEKSAFVSSARPPYFLCNDL